MRFAAVSIFPPSNYIPLLKKQLGYRQNNISSSNVSMRQKDWLQQPIVPYKALRKPWGYLITVTLSKYLSQQRETPPLIIEKINKKWREIDMHLQKLDKLLEVQIFMAEKDNYSKNKRGLGIENREIRCYNVMV